MSQDSNGVYEFGAFVLNARERLLTKDTLPVSLPPKAFDLLLVLVQNNGSLMKKEDLFDLLWPVEAVEEGNIPYNIALVRKALGDRATKPLYIATIPKQGYRFIATVKSQVATADPALIAESETVDKERTAVLRRTRPDYSPFKKHLRHLLGACILYALYYSVAFVLETAYQYETYGSRAVRFASIMFFWILGTSIAGFAVGLKRTSAGSGIGLVLTVSVFVAAALLLYVAAAFVLPNIAITQASFQTYPAHGAFLKNIYCMLPLAVLFMVVPSHYIAAAESRELHRDWRNQLTLSDSAREIEPRAVAVYLKTSWLVWILIGAFLVACVGSAHLFENLKPNPNLGLFIQLNQWRLLLYFLLGFECVLWYQQAQRRSAIE
ncbi:MAG TPA: transcriptional regulator [Pyrinomonadaceae bacterium]|nr:transcriptional regulator [Pyrinomonadaceae bacterium]